MLIILLIPATIAAFKAQEKEYFAHEVIVEQGAPGFNFSYTSVLSEIKTCKTHLSTSCRISTNIPLSVLNKTYRNSLPTQDLNILSPTYCRYKSHSTIFN